MVHSPVQVLLDRLRNEITRLTTVKAFTRIAESPLQLSFGPHMQPLLAELISFLRKANRPLRQASLSAIDVRCPLMLAPLQCALD